LARGPKGKRIVDRDGAVSIAGKNANGAGSVYFEGPSRRGDGTVIPGRWRASYAKTLSDVSSKDSVNPV
jgi:hypothetical protein